MTILAWLTALLLLLLGGWIVAKAYDGVVGECEW